jgi:hypothetical protein
LRRTGVAFVGAKALTARLVLASLSRYLPPAVAARVYIVSFGTRNDRKPSKFAVVANDRKKAISMASEHGGPDFQSRFDSAEAEQMKEGVLRFCEVSVLLP